jgi:hypothetical protein
MEEKQNAHCLLITGGQIGRQIVPKIKNLSQLHAIVVYCMNKQANEQWSRDYEKVQPQYNESKICLFLGKSSCC